jgi:hypothetical protein
MTAAGKESSPQGVDGHDMDAVVVPVRQLTDVEAHASQEGVA